MTSAEKLTREEFRAQYADTKPGVELIDGRPEPKALGSIKHGRLQAILARMLSDLGYQAYTELSLAISDDWEPVPDVAGVLQPQREGVYQSEPPAVVIEILSPSDRFILLAEKCRRYAEWGIADILVFDPEGKRAWYWNRELNSLVLMKADSHALASASVKISIAEAFRRLEA